MNFKGVRPTTISGNIALGYAYMHLEWNLCLGICVPCLKIYDIALGFMKLYWDTYTYIQTYPPTLGSMSFSGDQCIALGYMSLHWEMTRMPHHHNFHVDYSRRVPFPSWTILTTCGRFLRTFMRFLHVDMGCYEWLWHIWPLLWWSTLLEELHVPHAP